MSIDVHPHDASPFEELPAGVIELDASLRVLSANTSAVRAFARHGDTRGLDLFAATYLSASLRPALQAVLQTGEPFSFWGYSVDRPESGRSYWDVTIRCTRPSPGGGNDSRALLLFGVDVSSRVDAERTVQEAVSRARKSAEALRTILTQMTDGVLTTDEGGRVELVNDAARSFVGAEQEGGRFAGTEFLLEGGEVVPPSELPWARATHGGETVLVIRRDGMRDRVVSVSAAPLRDERNAAAGSVAVIRDVTGIERALAELRQANARLEENSRLKSEFVANMSHELRTPLNAILGFAQLLRIGPGGKDLTPRQHDSLERIQRNGKSLLSLIDGILDVAKIEAGVRTLHPSHFDLVEAVESAFGELESLANQKKLRYAMRVEGEFPLVFNDRGRLRQIIVNLLSNALKFTNAGEVSLVLRREDGAALIEVRDTGIGIRGENLSNIFDKFRQLDGSTTRDAGGVGLGLSIVRDLATLIGGTVGVTSTYGEGSTFTLQFPLEPTATLSRPAVGDDDDAEPPPSEEGGEKKGDELPLVLVIEDNPDSAVLLRRTLESSGFRVRVADNGVQGLRLARALRPAAVTLDIMMPRMDGWRVLQAVRADAAIADTPVIVCSIVDNRLLGYRLGASDYLTKPVEPNALISALSNLGVGARAEVLVVDDERALRDVVAHALREGGLSVRQARSGEEALRMVSERRPEAIFLDVIMPGGMSGFEFLAHLRSRPATADIPVIVLTGRDLTQEDRSRLRASLAHVVRSGELDVTELAERLRQALPRLGKH